MATVSSALTRKVCSPWPRPLRDCGEVQLLKSAPSRLHLKVEPSSLEEKTMLAELLVAMAGGPLSMVVSGGVASTVKARLAGVASSLPAGSVARTSKV